MVIGPAGRVSGGGDPNLDGSYEERLDVLTDTRQRRRDAAARLRWVDEWLPTGRVLEAGSGGGFFLERARDAGYEAVGAEPLRSLAEQTRQRLGVEIYAQPVEEVELGTRTADAACAFHVLEHTAQPVHMLESLRRLVRPGGLLFVEVPNIEAASARRLGRAWSHFDPDYHAVHFSPLSLRTALEQAGWEVLDLHTLLQAAYLRTGIRLRPRVVAGRLYRAVHLRSFRTRHPTEGDFVRAVARRAA